MTLKFLPWVTGSGAAVPSGRTVDAVLYGDEAAGLGAGVAPGMAAAAATTSATSG
ncbi:MAG: hypothetical protein V3T62_12135 [Alphaproteobacteria bacterium]